MSVRTRNKQCRPTCILWLDTVDAELQPFFFRSDTNGTLTTASILEILKFISETEESQQAISGILVQAEIYDSVKNLDFDSVDSTQDLNGVLITSELYTTVKELAYTNGIEQSLSGILTRSDLDIVVKELDSTDYELDRETITGTLITSELITP